MCFEFIDMCVVSAARKYCMRCISFLCCKDLIVLSLQIYISCVCVIFTMEIFSLLSRNISFAMQIRDIITHVCSEWCFVIREKEALSYHMNLLTMEE
jgi:hypothetical protein